MDDKLTRKSQEALSVAIRKAAASGNPQVDPLHLLAALLEQADGTAAPLLRAVGADPALIARRPPIRSAGCRACTAPPPAPRKRHGSCSP